MCDSNTYYNRAVQLCVQQPHQNPFGKIAPQSEIHAEDGGEDDSHSTFGFRIAYAQLGRMDLFVRFG